MPLIFFIGLTILALGCEVAAGYFVVNAAQGTHEVIWFLGLHLAASLLFATVVRNLLPIKFRDPIGAVLGLLASFAFFIPVLGLIALAAGVFTVLATPRAGQAPPFEIVRTPTFAAPIRGQRARIRTASLRSLLLNPTIGEEVRVRSLMALQSLPIRRAGPLLRRLLGDPADDIRLTAYSLLDREAKRISADIDSETATLAAANQRAARITSLRRLAEHYWELVYAGLAQADLAEFAVGRGLQHCEEAITAGSTDPGLWFLKGRLLNAAGDSTGAVAAFHRAAAAGLPLGRVAPYLAEIAFDARSYAEVKRHMGSLDPVLPPTLVPLARFWAGESRLNLGAIQLGADAGAAVSTTITASPPLGRTS